jgi:HK97 family phage prohead protease
MANDFRKIWNESFNSGDFQKNTTPKSKEIRVTKKASEIRMRKSLGLQIQKSVLEIASNILEVAQAFAKEIAWVTINGAHIPMGANEPADKVLSQGTVQHTLNDIAGQAQIKKMDALADKIRNIKLPDEVKSVKQLEVYIKSALTESERVEAKPFLENRFNHLYAMAEHADEYPGMYVKKAQADAVRFEFMIEKAWPVDNEGVRIPIQFKKLEKSAEEGVVDLDNMYIEGVASTTNVDHDGERMAPEAIDAMIEQVNKTGVPLMNEHQKSWDSRIGDIFKAWKDERGQMYIKAKLDKDSSRAVDLYKAMKKGLQVGLSVAGFIQRSAQELVDGLGKRAKTFYDVVLKEISVTNRPSNFDTWLIAKHQSGSLEGHLFESSHPSYEEYLQNFPSLNWQSVIAKSVAEVSTYMADEIKKDDKATETVAKDAEKKMCKDAQGNEIECAEKSQQDQMAKAIEGINTLSKQIADLLTVVKASQMPTETSETTDDEDEDDKKKKDEEAAKKSVKKDAVTEPNDEKTKTETKKSAEEVKKSADVDTEEFSKADLRAYAEIIADKLEKRMEAKGTRILGPLVDVIEKSLSKSQGRKSIGSEKAYLMEKNFANDSEKKADKDAELQKDIKDEKSSFQDVFKKHFSSFNEE